jgi:hypothetical protein
VIAIRKLRPVTFWRSFLIDTGLIYLMGGENREFEIGEFPRLKKRAIFEKSSQACIVDAESTTPFTSRRTS